MPYYIWYYIAAEENSGCPKYRDMYFSGHKYSELYLSLNPEP